jgi:hypothetical protein
MTLWLHRSLQILSFVDGKSHPVAGPPTEPPAGIQPVIPSIGKSVHWVPGKADVRMPILPEGLEAVTRFGGVTDRPAPGGDFTFAF